MTAPNKETFKADYEVEVSGDIVHTVKGPLTFKTSGDMDIKADAAFNAQGMAVTIQGMTSVKLKVAGNTIELTPASIDISASGTVTIGGSLITTLGGIVLISGTPVNIN